MFSLALHIVTKQFYFSTSCTSSSKSSSSSSFFSLSFFQWFSPDSVVNSLLASITGGFVVVACMTPFDVVSTRMFNQPVCNQGRGTMYTSVPDCFVKIFKKEGVWGFYKGWGPSFFRLVPHTILSLVFWDQLRILHREWRLRHER